MGVESRLKSEYVSCALCGSDDTEFFLEDKDFHLVRCKRCGLVYINPRPTQEELARMYNLPAQTERGLMDHAGYVDLAYLHELKAKMMLNIIRKYKKKGKILDIGCGAGFFLNLARQQGFDPYGIEVSKAFCSFARRSFRLDVFCGTLSELNYPNGYFDIVTMFDVLSHLSTPVENLNEVYRLLGKNGLLLIETGNRGELHTKALDKWHSELGSPSHLYHFGTKTLMRLLEMTGFSCLEIKRYPVIVSSVMETALRRIAGRKSKSAGYRQLRPSISPLIKGGLIKGGAPLYLFAKYSVGKLLPKSNIDCTLIACCRKI